MNILITNISDKPMSNTELMLKELASGDAFYLHNELYIKTDERYAIVRLKDGTIFNRSEMTLVEVANVKISEAEE